jgi:hypothetical protein
MATECNKSSRAISRLRMEFPSVSESFFVSIIGAQQPLMMGAYTFSETLYMSCILTRLIAREDLLHS